RDLGTDRGEATCEATRRTSTFELGDIDSELFLVHLCEPPEPSTQQCHLTRRRTLLRREHLRRVEKRGPDIDGRNEFDTAEPSRRGERPNRSEAPVGRRRSAVADEDAAGTSVEGREHQLTRTSRRRTDRIVAVGTAHEF